jgi:hypothetical protein
MELLPEMVLPPEPEAAEEAAGDAAAPAAGEADEDL